MSKTLSNNENIFQIGPQLTKNGDSTRKHPLKKVFGEIKNVIHNQGIPTPLKTDAIKCNKPIASKSVLRMKHKGKQIVSTNTNGSNSCSNGAGCFNSLDDIKLLNYFDFRGECCSYPYKSDAQIWAELNLYDDSFLNKITEYDETQLEDEHHWNISTYNDYDSDDDILDELKDGFNLYYCPNVDANNSNSDDGCFNCKPMY